MEKYLRNLHAVKSIASMGIIYTNNIFHTLIFPELLNLVKICRIY